MAYRSRKSATPWAISPPTSPRPVYRHVIVPEIRGGATIMDDVFDDD
jgi:hypothetical protein